MANLIKSSPKKVNKFGEWFKKISKIKNFEIAVAIILLAFVLLVYAGVNAYKKNSTTEMKTKKQVTKIEEEMEQILSRIDGAGKVKVMITYDGTVEYITANTINKNKTTSQDGDRLNDTTSEVISPVIVNQNGESGPVILKEVQPDIKGVIIVAEGAYNKSVKLELMRAVMVALDVGAENIEVFVMK